VLVLVLVLVLLALLLVLLLTRLGLRRQHQRRWAPAQRLTISQRVLQGR
jgi:hypothetical protein